MAEGPATTTVGTLRQLAGVEGGADDDVALDELVEGASIDGDETTSLALWALTSVAGPDALRTRRLGPGASVVIGRTPALSRSDDRWLIDDSTLSLRHCRVAVGSGGDLQIEDLQSTNGTFVESVGSGLNVLIGASSLLARQVKPPAGHRAPTADGFDPVTGTFAQRRLPISRRRVVPVDVPAVRAAGRARMRVRPGALVGPLIGAAAMALLFDPKFAAFALLSPILLLVNVIDDRRTVGRERRTGERDFAAAMAAFIPAVHAHVAEAAARRVGENPGLAELVEGADARRLWHGHPGADGSWPVRCGTGPQRPVPVLREQGPRADAVTTLLDDLIIEDGPITLDLRAGSFVVVVGARSASVVRAMVVEAALTFGPQVLAVLIDGVPDWAAWCPHAVTDVDACRLTLVAQPGGRSDMWRRALRQSAPTAIVVMLGVDCRADVPPEATVIIDLGSGPTAIIRDLVDGTGHDEVIVDGLSEVAAASAMRELARWRESTASNERPLPKSVAFGDVLGMLDDRPGGRSAGFDGASVVMVDDRSKCTDVFSDAATLSRWAEAPVDQRSLEAVIGVDDDGVCIVDLVADGPHALIAGTTGAGKSELLRTLIAGLAARYGPDLVTFVLVDYKGGSAFAECASFPQTVGFVTDLDDGLAQRALTCLEGELRYREQVLRASGARDLVSYASVPGRPALPRLLVVIDELAALVRDLPGFVSALVSLAQRGRSLGLHLVLATQRPAGTINDAIRANTNIRIALRVQDVADAVDVVGEPGAALLDRRVPGRALVRLGPGEVSALQVASVATEPVGGAVVISSFDGSIMASVGLAAAADRARPLARLADGLNRAFVASGMSEPRRPWPAPLPSDLRNDGAGWEAGHLGVIDRPAEQRQEPFVVDLAAGHVSVVGANGTGVSTTLRTLVLASVAAAGRASIPWRWVFVLDLLGRDLEGLAPLACVGAVVGPHEDERRDRLIAIVQAEVARRRQANRPDSLDPGEPEWVVVVDGWSALRAAAGDVGALALADALTRLVVEGGAVGIRFILGADRASSLPSSLAPSIATRFVLAPADPLEAAAAGVRPCASGATPGRALIAGQPGVEVQIARSDSSDVEEVASSVRARSSRVPPSVGVLPDDVWLSGLLPETPSADLGGDAWLIPFALSATTMDSTSLVLRTGEPVLIAGPARSGRSTALSTVAASAGRILPMVRVELVSGGIDPVATVRAALDAARTAGERLLLLVDDVDRVDDVDGVLAAVMASRDPSLRVVLAGRSDRLRGAYGHWSSPARRTRHGVALQPNLDTDGELWQRPFPRRLRLRGGPGRALVLSDGAIEVVQVARPG